MTGYQSSALAGRQPAWVCPLWLVFPWEFSGVSPSGFRCLVPGATISYQVSGNTFPGQLNATVFNFGAGALATGVTTLNGSVVPELVALNVASTPTGFNIAIASMNGVPMSFPMPPGILADRELMRMQSLMRSLLWRPSHPWPSCASYSAMTVLRSYTHSKIATRTWNC